VTDAVTVRAHKVALRRFLHEPSEASAELSEAELLCRWIPVMELQRFRASGVATIDAPSTIGTNEIQLSFPAPLPQRSPELLAAPIASCLRRLLGGSNTEWHLRSVVIAKGRAVETETPAVERPHLSVDDHLRRELTPTRDADKQLRRPHNRLAWPLERPVRATIQAMLPATQIASPTVSPDFGWKTAPANHTDEH